MNEEEKDNKVKETFSSNKIADKVKISNEFYRDLFFQDVKGNFIVKESMPIEANRIIINILNVLRNRQFQYGVSDDSFQLDLFKKTYLEDDESYAKIVMRTSDISKSRNLELTKKGLQFLVNYKQEWHTVKYINSKGDIEKKQFYGGLIIDPTIYKGQVSFYINPYWFKKIVALANYNYVLYSLVYSVKSHKQFLFALWLNTLKEDGTKVTLEYMNRTWGINYKDLRTLKKGFLDPIKKVLDKSSSFSFNSSVSGNFIGITRYQLKSIGSGAAESINLSSQDNQFKLYKLSYIKKRHNLTKKELEHIEKIFDMDFGAKFLFSSAYKNLVKKYNTARRKDNNNPLITDIPFSALLDEIQEEVISLYSATKHAQISPKGYPIFNAPL
ncbi:hypothetical protein MG290_14470 (plasmid) [Flavobacterium sp. CBA20B-1]|uniref:hypothetical protein n=1 Tax=unclassified Flavobacterium TaxID=196869 RepID=UPI002224D2A1|nr:MULTISPECIES: hypothetical protein [unclassified Flavobacterium]WCM43590.1 hypothetical protein MG290_14470 [Flavobacterium sp. CBA20B-1]